MDTKVGPGLPFEINTFTMLSPEQKRIIIDKTKRVSVPLMEVVELGRTGKYNLRQAENLRKLEITIKTSKFLAFIFVVVNYILFALGADLGLSTERYFTGPFYKWYGHFCMWLSNIVRKQKIAAGMDEFKAQSLAIAVLFLAPLVISACIILIERLFRYIRECWINAKMSAKNKKEGERCKKRIEELLSRVDLNEVAFIAPRYRSGTCLTQIVKALESGGARCIQEAYTKCEQYLKERYGEFYIINPNDCNMITYNRGTKEVTEYM